SLAEASGLNPRHGSRTPRVSREERLELSYAQQRQWFLAQLEGVSESYHIPMGLRLRGALNIKAWRRSLDRLVARHEGLRTVFVSEEGRPHVELLPATCGFTLIEHDLEEETEKEKRLAQLCEEKAQAA